MTDAPAQVAHSIAEDVLALFIGTLLVSFGIALFKNAGLLTGSTAGLAFLFHYLTGLPFGALFFVINVPFYYFAFMRMGGASPRKASFPSQWSRCFQKHTAISSR